MGKQKQKIYNPDPKNRIKSNNWQFWAIIALPVIYAVRAFQVLCKQKKLM